MKEEAEVRKFQKPAGAVALAIIAAVTVAGCTNREEPAKGGNEVSDGNAMAPLNGANSASPASSSNEAGAPFGKACSKLPQTQTGDLPAAEAIAKIPMLANFSEAVQRAGLGPELNKQGEHYTVFATTDSATAPNSADKLRQQVLTEQQNRSSLTEGKQFSTLAGNGKLSVSGSGDELTVTGSDGAKANVICGNIKAANATIFIIDKPL